MKQSSLAAFLGSKAKQPAATAAAVQAAAQKDALPHKANSKPEKSSPKKRIRKVANDHT